MQTFALILVSNSTSATDNISNKLSAMKKKLRPVS